MIIMMNDNAANMRGKYKGVQSRILELNPMASFSPCGGHFHHVQVIVLIWSVFTQLQFVQEPLHFLV